MNSPSSSISGYTSNSAQKLAKKQMLQSAADYYGEKIRSNPNLSRYSHFMGALTSAQGDVEKADMYYRQTISNTPNDMGARNDFAMHLVHNEGRKQDGIKELRKALLISQENSLLQKNIGAVLGQTGDLRAAMEHATQARYLAPNDAMNHRNLAKLHSHLGDTHSALQHNMASIDIENPKYTSKPNTSAYRAAAVQIIARGGSRSDALSLVDAARALDNKHTELPTSQRTYEIIYKIKQRQAHHLEIAEKARKAEEERRKASEERWKQIINKHS